MQLYVGNGAQYDQSYCCSVYCIRVSDVMLMRDLLAITEFLVPVSFDCS